MKKCFFDHLKGKEVFMARARLQEKEEQTEIKIFNEHKERMKKLMAQKKMVRPNSVSDWPRASSNQNRFCCKKQFSNSSSDWRLCQNRHLIR